MTKAAFPTDSRVLRLAEAEARGIVRLLGEVFAEGDLPARRYRFVNGLSELIAADSWSWATTYKTGSGGIRANCGFASGGFTPQQFARFQEALEHPDNVLLHGTLAREAEQQRTHLTRRREEIDPENHSWQSAARPLWQAAGVDQEIMSVRPVRQGCQVMIGFYRRPGRPPFLPRDSRLAHLVLSEVPALYEMLVPARLGAVVRRLSRRERLTLNLLLSGQDRRQIAKHLRLSYHTVDSYAKALYRDFNAHSQPALIACFRAGEEARH